AKARPWLLVMECGMARGNRELADRFEAGARANKGDPTSFRRNMSTFRGQASTLALHFAQVFGEFQKSKDDSVPLAFPYPTGNTSPPFLLTRVATGIIPTTGD